MTQVIQSKDKLGEAFCEFLQSMGATFIGEKPVCPRCKKVMVNDTDPITHKKWKYIWKCKCNKGLRLSVG